MDPVQPLDEHFVALGGSNVAYHRPTGLVVSVSRRVILTPIGRFRFEHPSAMKTLQENRCDTSIYNRLFESADQQNYIVVADNGLSTVLEVVTVSVCGTCKKYCNTSLRGNGFKEHYKQSPGCGSKVISNLKMNGFRFFMAKKKCVFVLIESKVELVRSSRSPTPEADILKTPKDRAFTAGSLHMIMEKGSMGPVLLLKETLAQVPPKEFIATSNAPTRPLETPKTTTEMNNFNKVTNGPAAASSKTDPLSYPQNSSNDQSNFTPTTSTPKLHQSTFSFGSTKSVVDSSSEVSPSMDMPPRPFGFRVPSIVPRKPVTTSTKNASSHSTPQMRSASLQPVLGNLPSLPKDGLTSATNTDLYDARARLQVPVATTSISSLNFTNDMNDLKRTPPKRSSTSMSVVPSSKKRSWPINRSMTPAVNGRTMFASPKKQNATFTLPHQINLSNAPLPPPQLYSSTTSTRKPSINSSFNDPISELLNNAKWVLQQTLLREAHVAGRPSTTYVNKLITPGTMENKMISPTLLLQAVLTRVRPMEEHSRLIAVTGPWGLTITDSSTGIQIDLFIRPFSNGPEDEWSIQIKITYVSDSTSMTTSNDLQWTSVSYQTICTTLLCFTTIMKELFNSPHTVDIYSSLKTGLPMLVQMVKSHAISGVDVIRGWLNDTMQTSNPRRVTLAGAPLG